MFIKSGVPAPSTLISGGHEYFESREWDPGQKTYLVSVANTISKKIISGLCNMKFFQTVVTSCPD